MKHFISCHFEPDDLQKHIFATYFNLRIGIAVIAIIFPVILSIGGYIQGISLQSSMSAYYHEELQNGESMRDWFVGILFAIGVFLNLYRGFTQQENNALNLAGIFAIGIAIFPEGTGITVHAICAILFFLCIGYVCIWRASDTLYLLKNDSQERMYRITYKVIGVFMITFPLLAFLFSLLIQQTHLKVFFIEAFGVWVFAYYWLMKSRELSYTHAERRALNSEIKI